MKRWTTLGPCFVLSLTVAGCYGGKDGEGDPEAEDAGDDESGGDDDDDDDNGDGDGGDPQARCEESKIGPPMLRRLTRAELEQTIRVVFPEIDGAFEGVELGADTVSYHGFGNDADVLAVSEQVAREIMETAEHVAALVVDPGTLPNLLPCATSSPGAACAETFVTEYGRRLFRRSLTDAELAEYATLFADVSGQSDFATGIQWTLVALLQSPHVVYRSELGTDDGEGRHVLEGWELATALAYDFSGGPPNDTLLDLGASGALQDPDTRVEQARELLATAAGRETLAGFFEDWLDYREVATKTRPDVPEFEGVRDAMTEETRRFIETVVVDDEGGVSDLLLADYTSVDATLAQYYGFSGVEGDFEVVPRPDGWGVGLLAQGSVLAANAHVDASSPTQRGLLVYERLLCRQRPPVPEDIPAIEPPSPGSTTTRQRYEEQHMANDGCRSCHELFDPIGFAFEHFDAAGRYRADESGLPIDATGTIPKGVLTDADLSFDGLSDLSKTLAAEPGVTDCVSGLTATYVFGGAGGTGCLAEDARAGLAEEQFGLLEYVARLAGAPHFDRRALPE